jgi:hypothetical protein
MKDDRSGRSPARILFQSTLPLLLPLLLSACQIPKNADWCETSAIITADVVVGAFAIVGLVALLFVLVAYSSQP